MSAWPRAFDAGERETLAVAMARGWTILTNERLVKNWCQRTGLGSWDLPGILRALWRRQLRTREEVRALVTQIETHDRIVFKDPEQIFVE